MLIRTHLYGLVVRLLKAGTGYYIIYKWREVKGCHSFGVHKNMACYPFCQNVPGDVLYEDNIWVCVVIQYYKKFK